jgi:hypothetical protein
MARRPGALVHAEHRPHEHVAAARQHDHERPHPPGPLGQRAQPRAQVAVVHLALLARRHLGARRGGDVGQVVFWQFPPYVAPEARHAHLEAVLVAQALVHGRGGAGLEHLGDLGAVGVDGGVGEAALAGVDQLREPPVSELGPALHRQLLAAGHIALRLRLGGVLGDGAPVHSEAPGHLGLLPAGVPVHEDLDDVDHCETSPCHWRSSPRRTRTRLVEQGARVVDPPPQNCGIT